MNELIKVSRNENEQQVVSARELYAYLGYENSQFSRWAKSKILENGFSIENEDWVGFDIIVEGNKVKDYALSLDFAKRLSMMAKTEKGEKVRNYFIDCEKKLKEQMPSYLIKDEIERAKAWIIEAEERKQLQEQNKALQFRSDFVDVCFDTDGLFSMEEAVKILKLPFGRNEMMKQLREKGVLTSSNSPTQRFISNGYFKVVESMIENGAFKKLTSTTYATQKGIGHIHKLFAKQ